MMMLEVENVGQSFRAGFWMKRAEVLKGINLKIPERSIYGFLGANGAGKTTLIHLITGLRKPSAGRVLVMGNDASSEKARSCVGYLPERPYFHEHLTGNGLLRYFGVLAGLSRAEIQARSPKVLKAVDLKGAEDLELRNYSKGMLQRIGIAQALIHDPEFLVLDEPMSGLDPLGRKEIRELILTLASEGRTIFFSSHIIPDVEAICDQVAVIRKGSLLGCGPIGQFLSQGPLKTEIAFSSVTEERAGSIGELASMRKIPGGICASVSSQDSVSRVLAELLRLNAKILWVTPIRPTLESIFEES